MAIKFKAKTKDEIPAELQSLYVEGDGGFVLDVEGAVDKTKLDEFRSNNIALSNQLAETKRRFEGIESEQVRAVAAERDALNARLTALQVDEGVVASATRRGCGRRRFQTSRRGRGRCSSWWMVRRAPTRPTARLCAWAKMGSRL